jgi:hypothetical protein
MSTYMSYSCTFHITYIQVYYCTLYYIPLFEVCSQVTLKMWKWMLTRSRSLIKLTSFSVHMYTCRPSNNGSTRYFYLPKMVFGPDCWLYKIFMKIVWIVIIVSVLINVDNVQMYIYNHVDIIVTRRNILSPW